jgi:hypothetical protein
MNIFKQIPKVFFNHTSNGLSYLDKLAIRRAYANFARRHPDWAAAYFDESFLAQHMGPALVREPKMSRRSMAFLLATEWSQQFQWANKPKRRRLVREATAIANSFLQLLEDECSGRAAVLSPVARGI